MRTKLPAASLALVTRLADVFEPAYTYYARRPQLSRTLLETSLFAVSPWKERFASQAIRVNVRIVEIVEAARSRGEIAADTNVPVFSAAVFSFYYMALIGWVFIFATSDLYITLFGLGTLALGILFFFVWSWRSGRWPFAQGDEPRRAAPAGSIKE